MKVVAWTPKLTKMSRVEGTISLRLYQDSITGATFLVACHLDGTTVDGGGLLRINSNGTISRLGNIDPEIGLPLVDGGKVRVE